MDMRKGAPTAVSTWDFRRLTKARGRLRELLAGVGTGEDYWQAGDAAYHLRRRLSEAELGRLDPEWLALPAVDGA
jgi:hypothetical protein